MLKMNPLLSTVIIIFFFSATMASQVLALDVEDLMEMSLEDLLNTSVVSATKKEQSIGDAPAIVTVITSQQIRDRGYRSVAEALGSVVGLDMLHDRFQPNLGVRGVNGGMRSYSRIVKVMIDGQPISFRSSSDNFLDESLIPMNVVQRIEVIKGPNSALYGADAYQGVINIITKTGASLDNGVLALTTGSVQGNTTSGGSGVLGRKSENLDFVIAASYSKTDRSGLSPQDIPDATRYSNQTSTNDIAKPLGIFGKLQYSKESFGTLGFDMNYQRIDSYSEFQDWGVLTGNNRISLYNWYARGTYSRSLSDKLEGNLSLAYAKGEPTSNEKLSIGTSDWYTRELSYSGIDTKAELMYNINDKNSFISGFDYTRDDHTHQTFYRHIDTETEMRNTDWVKDSHDVPESFDNTGLYVQSILHPASLLQNGGLLENFSFTSGLRFDKHSVYGDEITYRAALVYKFTEKVYTKLLFGTSFKAPSSSQLYTNFIKTDGVIGNPDLEPEKAKIIDLQVAGQVTSHVFFNVDLFTSKTKNKVELGTPLGSSEATNVRALNLSEISSWGFEGELMFNIARFSTYFNYAYQKSEIAKSRVDEPASIYDAKTNLYPAHMVKFGVNRKFPSVHLNINLEGRHIDSRIASEENTIALDRITYLTFYNAYLDNRYGLDYYTVFDFMISTLNLKLFGDMETEFIFKVYNALDEKYAFPGYSGDFDIPGLERSFSFSLVQHY